MRSQTISVLLLLFTTSALADTCREILTANQAPNTTKIVGGLSGYVSDLYNQMRLQNREEKYTDQVGPDESYFGFKVGNIQFLHHTWGHSTRVNGDYTIDTSAADFDEVYAFYDQVRRQELESVFNARPDVEKKKLMMGLSTPYIETNKYEGPMSTDLRHLLENRALYFSDSSRSSGDASIISKIFADARAKYFADAVIKVKVNDTGETQTYTWNGIVVQTTSYRKTVGEVASISTVVDLRWAESVQAFNYFINVIKEAGQKDLYEQILLTGFSVIQKRHPILDESAVERQNVNAVLQAVARDRFAKEIADQKALAASHKITPDRVQNIRDHQDQQRFNMAYSEAKQKTQQALLAWQLEANKQSTAAQPKTQSRLVSVVPVVQEPYVPSTSAPKAIDQTTATQKTVLPQVAVPRANVRDESGVSIAIQMPVLRNQTDRATIQLLARLLPDLFRHQKSEAAAVVAKRHLEDILNASALPVRNSRLADQLRAEANKVGGIDRLWARVGLDDVFRITFADADRKNFWNSALTLTDIYKNLYRRIAERRAYINIQTAEYQRPLNERVARASQFEANSRGLTGSVLLLKTVDALEKGQIVWSVQGKKAIVGVDDLSRSRRYKWGLIASDDLTLGVSSDSNETVDSLFTNRLLVPPVEVEGPTESNVVPLNRNSAP